MKAFWLVCYFLSSGQFIESFATLQDCEDALKLAQIVKGDDLWSGTCVDDDKHPMATALTKDIGP